MPRVELIGDFVEESFVLPFQAARIRWTEETKSLDRLGGVFLTKDLLSACYKTADIGHQHLPEYSKEHRPRGASGLEGEPTFYSQLFELDPESRLTVRVLQRRLFKGEREWSITGQLSRLGQSLVTEDCVLFVEQEEYTSVPRSEETQALFAFVAAAPISSLVIKTNKPYVVLEAARAAQIGKPTVILTTLRALAGHALHYHTWDAAVRHVLQQLGHVPTTIQVGVELWNEGCLWLGNGQGHLFWDMELPLGAQRLRGRGWTPGSMNVSCASLLSRVGEADWPTPDHVRESWVLSRQCALLGNSEEAGGIVDLPGQLGQLLHQVVAARPRAHAFAVAQFDLPIGKDWTFLNSLNVDEGLVERVVTAGPGTLRDRNCPFLRRGRLFEIEETTIEQLLTLNHLLQDYASRRLVPRPLSIAVLGPAGSGKSFSVVELTRSADLLLDPVFLSYNLSQMRSVEDLGPALHAVQSAVLRGNLPVVFWDEFDAALDGSPLGWLKYFLGPMQDGEFFLRGNAHPLGRSIFVFAGSTAETFADFRQRKDQVSKDAKLPDFASRIKAWLDVPQLPSSSTASGRLQRAILVHSLLRRHAPHITTIDKDVLDALVSDRFLTARSIEQAIEASALSDTNRFTHSRLLFTIDRTPPQ